LEDLGFDAQRFGWASIQLDGGIERVTAKIEDWFKARLADAAPVSPQMAGLEALRIGLVSAGPVSAEAAQQLADLTKQIVGAGGTVVLPGNTSLLKTGYRAALSSDQPLSASLAYAQQLPSAGLHVMETPSTDWVETLTGLGATGVELIVAYIGDHPMQSHPLVPVIQVTAEALVQTRYGVDLDLRLQDDPAGWSEQILSRLAEVISGDYMPTLHRQGNVDFQITRGLLGVSM
jgi:hypothetical protein